MYPTPVGLCLQTQAIFSSLKEVKLVKLGTILTRILNQVVKFVCLRLVTCSNNSQSCKAKLPILSGNSTSTICSLSTGWTPHTSPTLYRPIRFSSTSLTLPKKSVLNLITLSHSRRSFMLNQSSILRLLIPR